MKRYTFSCYLSCSSVWFVHPSVYFTTEIRKSARHSTPYNQHSTKLSSNNPAVSNLFLW